DLRRVDLCALAPDHGIAWCPDAEGRADATKAERSWLRDRRGCVRSLCLRLLLPLQRPALCGGLVYQRVCCRGGLRKMVPAATLPPLTTTDAADRRPRTT